MAFTKAQLNNLPHVRISLLDNQGQLRQISGLNWGQRPQYNRNPDEAYIRVPKWVDNINFFPPVGMRFVIRTDDNQILTCVRAQANGKAIETPDGNHLLGLYFRKRLGLASGALVRKADLTNYGRTDVDFYRMNMTTFYMDFS